MQGGGGGRGVATPKTSPLDQLLGVRLQSFHPACLLARVSTRPILVGIVAISVKGPFYGVR